MRHIHVHLPASRLARVARDASYSTCPECEANFASSALVAGKLPAHKFLGKPCPGSGGKPARDASASWVIREKGTGRVIMETFDPKKVSALNTQKYEAVPIQEYLGSINGRQRDEEPGQVTEARREYSELKRQAEEAKKSTTGSLRLAGLLEKMRSLKFKFGQSVAMDARDASESYAAKPAAKGLVIGTDKQNNVWYYTGRAGEGFVSRSRADAFTGYSMEGAKNRAQNLNAGTGAHGITFKAGPDPWVGRDDSGSRFDQYGEGNARGTRGTHVTEHENETLSLRELEQKRDAHKEGHEDDVAQEVQHEINRRKGQRDADAPFPRGNLRLAGAYGEGFGAAGKSEADLSAKLREAGYSSPDKEYTAALVGYRYMAKIRKAAGDRRRRDADYPNPVKYQGATYYKTGKEGTVIKTGEESAEYEEVVNGNKTGKRLWRTVSGKITPDAAMKRRDADPIIVVKALIEGWLYGPAYQKRLLESEEYGPYPTKAAAESAANAATVGMVASAMKHGMIRMPRDAGGMQMAVVQSSVTGEWSYMPEAARSMLRFEYDGDPTGLKTAEAAIAAAKSDTSVPKGATFKKYPTALQRRDRARDGSPPSAEVVLKWEGKAPASLVAHSMWSGKDYAYLRERGYSDQEVKDLWDRDSKARKGPVSWKQPGDRARDHGGPFPTVRMATMDALAKHGPGNYTLSRGPAGGVYWDKAKDEESPALKARRSELAHLRAREKEAREGGDKKMAAMFKQKADNLEASLPKTTDAGKTGVEYGVRPLGDRFGIWVKYWRNGQLETEDTNTTPWPTRAVALERAKQSAENGARQEGMKVLGQIAGQRDAEKWAQGTRVKYKSPSSGEADIRFVVLEDHRDANPPRVRIQSSEPMTPGSRFYPIEVVAPDELVRA